MKNFFQKLMTKMVVALDPKLDKYRPPKKVKPFRPETEKELVAVLKRTPKEVLSDGKRNLIAGAMSFDQISVASIMVPKKEMTFLHEGDFLGPLLLDKLYKTGANCFPVLDKDNGVCGLVYTDEIDPLKIEEDQPIDKFVRSQVAFVRGDYSLEMALATFLRTHSDYCIVLDREMDILGCLTLTDVVTLLFNREIDDSFDSDLSPYSVAHRDQK